MKIQYAVRDGLQKSINEFNAVGGVAVVMNIFNGEIISLVSLPYFDNSLFTSKFWESFQKAMGTHLSFSTAFHPQSQGQVERVRCYFEARVWKRIVVLSFLSFLSFFEGSLAAYFDYEIRQMHAKRRPSGIKSPK